MATTSVMGGAVRRREDPALIQGYGEYVDDLTRTGMLSGRLRQITGGPSQDHFARHVGSKGDARSGRRLHP